MISWKVAETRCRIDKLFKLCKNGKLKDAKEAQERFKITPEQIKENSYVPLRFIRDLCEKPCLDEPQIPAATRIEVLDWLIAEFDLSIRDETQFECNGNKYLMAACEGGELEIAKYLADKFKMAKEDLVLPDLPRKDGETAIDIYGMNVFQSACYGGHLEVVEWLYDRFKLTPEFVKRDNNHAFYRACTGRHGESGEIILKRRKLIKWMSLKFNLEYSDIASMIAKRKQIHCAMVHIMQ